MTELARAWSDAAEALGADPSRSAITGAWLAAQYDSETRKYHGTAHIAAVLRAIDELTGIDASRGGLTLDARELAIARAAACAHDVVYNGAAGQDEADSATWARQALTEAGADPDAALEVADIVLATADHQATSAVARAVLDADLAILAAEPADYEAYRRQVRAEYGRLDDAHWRAGRAAVLRSLLGREALYLSAAGRDLWEGAARRNMAAELATLDGPREQSTREPG